MWNHKPSDRLHEWKEFRENIGILGIDEAVSKTSHLWSYAPYVNHYLDADTTAEWPDPWTLLHENYYCDLAKALGMLYTLYLSPHYGNDIKSLEIRIYKNPTNTDVFNTVWIDDGKYILNLEFDTVVNKTQVNENLILLHCYAVEDLQLNLY
jgi:hypothetical protein